MQATKTYGSILAGMILVVLAAGVAVSAPGAASSVPFEHDSPDWVPTYNRLIGELMSPYCHGLTLDNCPTKGAADLRDEIKGWLMAGKSEDWILDELEMTYGPSILGAPRMSGIGLLAWGIPPLFFLFATIGVTLWVRRRVAEPEGEEAAAAPVEIDEEALAQVERELNEEAPTS